MQSFSILLLRWLCRSQHYKILHIGLWHYWWTVFFTRKKRPSTLPEIWGCLSLNWKRWSSQICCSNFELFSIKVQFSEINCVIFVVQGYFTFVNLCNSTSQWFQLILVQLKYPEFKPTWMKDKFVREIIRRDHSPIKISFLNNEIWRSKLKASNIWKSNSADFIFKFCIHLNARGLCFTKLFKVQWREYII